MIHSLGEWHRRPVPTTARRLTEWFRADLHPDGGAPYASSGLIVTKTKKRRDLQSKKIQKKRQVQDASSSCKQIQQVQVASSSCKKSNRFNFISTGAFFILLFPSITFPSYFVLFHFDPFPNTNPKMLFLLIHIHRYFSIIPSIRRSVQTLLSLLSS